LKDSLLFEIDIHGLLFVELDLEVLGRADIGDDHSAQEQGEKRQQHNQYLSEDAQTVLLSRIQKPSSEQAIRPILVPTRQFGMEFYANPKNRSRQFYPPS
jgi:hypothetical protein